ncbi:MAG TPA: UrcA family protein [Croceibacterium sp.]|jgi:UrcA family protein
MNMRTLALAAAFATIPAAAFAAPQSVEVQYGDLDLSTPQGQAQLDSRIERAARQICTRHEVTTGSIRSTTLDETCYRDAMAKLKGRLAAVVGHARQG